MDCVMHVRHGLAAALVTLLGLALAAPASAAVDATFSMGDLTVGMTESGDSARVFVDGTNIRVAEDSTIDGGTPTLTTTNTIRFEDFSGVGGGTTAVIDHSGGRFEPGAAESGDTDEIEFAFDAGTGNDVVRVILDPAGQEIAVGDTGINFNPGEPTPPAKDADFIGVMAAVESVVLQGGPGNDTITGSSTGAGVGTATTKPLTITGGGGDDDLTGGNGPDSINGQDGDNNDVISCREGSDSATVDFLDAVGADCESITRPPTGGGGTSTPPPTGNTTPPRPRLAPGRLVFRRRRIRVPVTCQASSARRCRGTVTIRRRGRVLGRGRYAAGPGRRVVVTVRVNARGVRLFLSRARTRVSLQITAVGGRSVRRSVVVRSPGVR
jgi:hypothetical protein